MLTMTKCSAGDIVLVGFPFTNLKSEKKRPALVLAEFNSRNRLLKQGDAKHDKSYPAIHLIGIAMITSQVDGFALPGDVLLEHWQSSGLLHHSMVRLSKVATIDLELVDRVLGRVNAKDLPSLRNGFSRIFGKWIE